MAIHVWIFRMTGGKVGGSMGRSKVVLLTTTGRKSGKTYTTPLGLFEWAGTYMIVASNGGGPRNPGWYFNLKSNPKATIQVRDKVIQVTAEVLGSDQHPQAWQLVVKQAPNYARYEKSTTREIPLVLLRPS